MNDQNPQTPKASDGNGSLNSTTTASPFDVSTADLAQVEKTLEAIDGKNKKLQAISDLPKFLGVETLEEALELVVKFNNLTKFGGIETEGNRVMN